MYIGVRTQPELLEKRRPHGKGAPGHRRGLPGGGHLRRGGSGRH